MASTPSMRLRNAEMVIVTVLCSRAWALRTQQDLECQLLVTMMAGLSDRGGLCAAQMARRRTKSANAPEVKPLTQEELLAEAAKTELENQRSLQVRLRV